MLNIFKRLSVVERLNKLINLGLMELYGVMNMNTWLVFVATWGASK